ncbi:hypothetical protein ATE49_14755 [Elizabethkingia miricola]|uniref:DUF6705 domain-containing protein n=1 Tax=Elizabethkingia miricola TaxID=172045 RepID=A0ABY3NCT3_ELIMR|nr:DUF6705 family protein [Elizabethkingia miricola]OBS13307.1 hypothetical protein ATE49_14755 [Elizabethkingia miricola]TYO88730.1 hypothetical protein LX74_03271 [Elizabethkingia miricola]
MKKNIIILTVFLSIFCIKAQTISISSYVGQIPNGAYLKDIDNTLPLFTGTWIANFEGKQVTLNISDKIENHPLKLLNTNYYSDVLFMRYTITDSNGNQLASTMNNAITTSNIISTYTSSDKNSVAFDYKGEECGIGEGYIVLKKIDSNHAKWEYHSTGGLIDPNQCPNYSDNIKSYIPRTLDLTFTKQ